MEATFYGLPMYRIGPSIPPVPPPPPLPLSTDPVTGLASASINSTPVFELVSGDDGSFYQIDGQTQVTHYRPIQPRTDFDVTQPDATAHGAIITGIVSDDQLFFDAVFSRPVIDLEANEPPLEFGDVAFPSVFQNLVTFNAPQGPRQRVVLTPGQFFRDANGIGVQRLLTSTDLVVYYSTSDDVETPFLGLIGSTVDTGDSTASFRVEVTDETGSGTGSVIRVLVLFRDPSGDWFSLDLVQEEGTDVWTGEAAITGEEIEYLVQAVDAAGNVAVSTSKGTNFSAQPPTVDAGPEQEVDEGDTFSLSDANFIGFGFLDTHSATIEWGDGTQLTNGAVSQGPGAGTIEGSHVYVDDGTYGVEVCVVGSSDNTLICDIFTVTVNNVPARVEAGVDRIVSEEAATVSLDPAIFEDPGTLDTHISSIDWGDDTVDSGDHAESNGSGTVSGSHTYAESGAYVVTVSVVDNGGATGADSLTVTVSNEVPVVDAGADQMANEGDVISLDPASFVDNGELDTHTATINWGDETIEPGIVNESDGSGIVDGSHAFVDNGIYTVTVTVTDDDGGSGSDTLRVTVKNVAPMVTATGSFIDENGTATVSGAITDPGSEDTFTVDIDWGEGTPETFSYPAGSTFYSESHQYLDDNPTATASDTYSIVVTVTDDDTGVGTADTSVTVDNVAPMVTATGSFIDENGTATVSGSITDPGSEDTFTVDIDWGEGTPETFSYPAGSTFYSESHQYLDDNPTGTASDTYSIVVTVTDDDTGVGTADTSVTVDNVAPIVTATGSFIDENGNATVSGSITDPGSKDTFTVDIDWGEGTPETFSYPAGNTFYSESHQYLDDNPTGTASDVYSIVVTVTDDDTGVGTADTSVTVDNVAPMVTATGSVIDEDGTATVSGAITDPGSEDTFTVDIDWGEGTPQTFSYPAGSTFYSESHQYLDDNPTGTASDTYSIVVTVTDDDTGVGTADTSVTVDNVAPIVTATGSFIDENGNATVSGSITDPGSKDTFTVDIDWGEGTPETFSYPAGNTFYSESHQYLDDNPTGTASDVYSIVVTVTDDDTGVGTADTSVTVDNVAPMVTATGSVIDEDGTATVSGSITDPGSEDTFTVDIDWGEGTPQTFSYPAGNTFYSESHQYLDDNPTGTPSDAYSIVVTVTDDDSGVGTADTSVTVKNVAPLVTATGSFIDENGTATVSGSITDPGSQDTFTVEIDWGEGTPETFSYPGGSTFYSETHQYVDDNPTGTASDVYPIVVTVTDDDSGVGTADTSVTVDNVAPIVTATGSFIDENGNAMVSGSITDPGSEDTFTVDIDWGEGTPQTFSYPAGSTFYSESHQYLDDNPTGTASDVYSIVVTVTDDDTGVGTADTSVTVKNVAPLVGLINAPLEPLALGIEIIATADFTDSGTLDTHTAVWDWGDGTESAAGVTESGGAGVITGDHAYAAEGVYVITLTVTDDDGGTDQTTFLYDVVFLNEGTFVTGGGWINSEPGAYAADQTASGKLSFGFIARSTKSKGSSTFSGQTQINFRVGELNFQSSAYDSLVIEGSKATYSGTGTINGSGEFGFVISVIDAALEGGGGKGGKKAQDGSAGRDKFRIRIFDNNTGTVIYDSEPAAPIEADPTTELGGGSIEIHKR